MVTLAGCATEVVDGDAAGAQVAAVVAERTGRDAAARCNGGQTVRVGLRLRCAVRFADGSALPVEVRVIDDRGAFDVVAGLPGQPAVARDDAPEPPEPFTTGQDPTAAPAPAPGATTPPSGPAAAPVPPAAGTVTAAP